MVDALLLAGPVVRRVEPTSASVWVALSKAASVTLKVWADRITASDSASTPIAAQGTASTLQIGENLHVVVVTAVTTAPAQFQHGLFHSYNLEITPAGGAMVGLEGLELLSDKTLANGLEQLALGYVDGVLPGFRTPPPTLSDLRIVHGGCRKPHDEGKDALPELDDFLDFTKPHSEEPFADVQPQMLFLTGDQIYADDVALCLLPLANSIGNELIGGTPESMAVKGTPVPATLDALPNGFRQDLVVSDANLTTTAGASHLLSFAEFCGMYLLTTSNVLWPAAFDPPTSVNAPAPSSSQAATIQATLTAIASGNATARANADRDRRAAFCAQLDQVKEFSKGLGAVRRALANIATYMICDDHEVTDDWYLTLGWKKAVLGALLGRQLIRNAQIAYAFFQGWGNDPAAFASAGDNAGFMDLAARAITSRSQADLDDVDAKLGLSLPFDPKVRWNYQLLNDGWRFGVLVLDERTRRGYRSDTSPPARIAPGQMTLQIPPPPALSVSGRDVLFVVAPAPVLGVPVIEELLQVGYARFSDFRHARHPNGQAEADLEPWSQDPNAFEDLLKFLAPAGKIVFLSGDVHFGHSAALTYWPRTAVNPSRFVQFTASAFKNSGDAFELDLIRSFGFGQRIFRSGAPTSRLGWDSREPQPLTFPADKPFASYPFDVRVRFRQDPLLLPGQVWPAGVEFGREPDWVWSLRLLFDTRSEAAREDRPLLPPNVPTTGDVPLAKLPDVARYHIEAMRQRGMSKQVVFAHNVGVVTVASDGGVLTARQTLFSPPVADLDVFKPLTVHEAALDVDPTETKPGLQP